MEKPIVDVEVQWVWFCKNCREVNREYTKPDDGEEMKCWFCERTSIAKLPSDD